MQDPGGGSAAPAVEVDITGLTDLAGQISAENNHTLRGRSGQVAEDFKGAAPFGGNSASGAVFAAKAKYERNMAQAVEVLKAYVDAADALASAAEKVAANYRGADALAAARSNDVNRALNDALLEIQRKALEAEARTRGGGMKAL